MKMQTLFAAGAALALTSVTLASNTWDPDLDKVIELPTFELTSIPNGGQSFSFDYTVQGNETGFSFIGDYFEVTPGASWASDMRLGISVLGVEIYSVGGLSTPSIGDWDFQGSGSTASGTYGHGVFGVPDGGDGNPDWGIKNLANAGDVWTFTFSNDWNSASSSTHIWSNSAIVIHKVPAPGALALLGLAGLAGTRRRRS